jgi:hypothetical protein
VVETGGLENRCTGNGTGGSNPSPSATQSGLQKSGYITSRIAENRRNSASGEYVTQITAIGPLGLEYLSPNDDPRNI